MKEYHANSDTGDVMIGVRGLTVKLSNGYGDGEVDIFVLDPGEEVSEVMPLQAVIEGENINIFDYDCSDTEVVATISGKFFVFSTEKNHRGCVYFKPVKT